MAKKDKVSVSFGHNAENVTGSYVLINCGQSGKKILVDFGMIQENTSLLKEYQMNAKRPNFKPKEVTYTFITHAHIDHSGRVPQLYSWGCEAPIIIPEGSIELYKAMLLDSANICFRDSEDLTRKLKKECEPLCTEEDVFNVLDYMAEYPVGKKIVLDDDISFQLNYNGHIFKSVSIIFWIKNGSQTRKIVVTGDIGNLSNVQKFTEEFEHFSNCNLLIGEATYASERRSDCKGDRAKDLEKIKAAITTTCYDRKGKVLIPTFAFGRSPVILATLYDIFSQDENFDIPIIYASPLGAKLLKIFLKRLPEEQKEYLDRVLTWKNVRILDNFEDFDKEVRDNSPKIICCPSGMMQAGYSVYAATQMLPHSNDMILFCGYSSEGSLAWKIKQKKTKTISIDGKSIHSRCQVGVLKSFSSHIQYDDLLKEYSYGDYDKIALVHSNQKDKLEFSRVLQKVLEKKNKTTKVVCVNNGTTINL